MIYVPGPRHPVNPVVINPYQQLLMFRQGGTGVPASGTWGTAARALFYPLEVWEPFVVAKAYWCNGATVGTDFIDIGAYLMTDMTTGRLDMIRSTGAVLSAGTVSVAQEAPGWRIARAQITSGNSSTDATSYATASVTLKAGRLYLLSVVNTKASADVISAVTGGPTFTSRATTQFNGTAHRVSLWSAVPTTDYTGTLTIDFGGGNTQTACVWSLLECSGVDTTTTDGIVQTATGTGSSTTPLATLGAFDSADNATFGINANVSDTTTTPGAGFTEMSDNNAATPAACMQTQWRVDNDTTSDGTITSAQWGAIAAEIKADTASPFVIPPTLIGVTNVYMGFCVSGTTATVMRGVSPNIWNGQAAGMLQLASAFPLPSSLIPVSAVTAPNNVLAGFSLRSLIG